MFQAGENDSFNTTFSSNQAQGNFDLNETSAGLDSQTVQTPIEELAKLYEFGVKCIGALEHRIPTLGDTDINDERTKNRVYRGLPPYPAESKYNKGKGSNPKHGEGAIPKSVNSTTSKQNKRAMSVPLNSVAVPCLCPEEACEFLWLCAN